MRKNASILAATLGALLFSGAALADDHNTSRDHNTNREQSEPQKKQAAEADSSQPVNDTWITTKVKSSLLADDDVSGLDIEVDTVDGVVFLTGNVDNRTQIEEAKRIAKDIDGVSRVDATKLQVSSSAQR